MFQLRAAQKRADVVEFEKACKLNHEMQKSALKQPRTDLSKFGLPVYQYTGIQVEATHVLEHPKISPKPPEGTSRTPH